MLEYSANQHDGQSLCLTIGQAICNWPRSLAIQISADSRITNLNQPMAETLGQPINTLKGTLLWLHLSPDNCALLQELIPRVIAEGRSFQQDLSFKGRWYDTVVAPCFDFVGQASVVTLVAWDITERQQTEAALKESEQFALATLDALEGNICVLDYTGQILAVNRSWRAFAQANDLQEPSAGVGSNYLSVCKAVKGADAHDAETFAMGFRSVVAGERDTFTMEYACHSPTEKRWFLERVTRFTDYPQGRLVVAHENITRRRLAEEAARASEQRLRRLGDNLPDGMVYQVIGDAEGGRFFSYVSAGVERIHGVPVEKVLKDATVLYSQVLEEDRVLLASQEAESLARMEALNVQIRIRHPRGEVRWIHINSAPSCLPEGQVRWDGVELDITEQKQLEERVHQSLKMESVGRLAGGIAHELNNLLGAMMMNLSMARLLTQVEEVINILPEVEGSCWRAAELIKHLLAFSSQAVLQLKPLNLAEMILEKSVTLDRTLGQSITVKVTCSDNLPWVRADKSSMEQVLMNLCLNARDAMPNGGALCLDLKEVTLSLEQASKKRNIAPGSYVCLSVIDTGCGMDERTIKKIFEPFFTTKAVGQGTGLGLATVHGIMQQHSGGIEVESKIGQGSTFRVYIPTWDDSPPV